MNPRSITERLQDLRAEFAKGQQMLRDLEREANEVREGLLRLSGAIQVLEELELEEQTTAPARDEG